MDRVIDTSFSESERGEGTDDGSGLETNTDVKQKERTAIASGTRKKPHKKQARVALQVVSHFNVMEEYSSPETSLRRSARAHSLSSSLSSSFTFSAVKSSAEESRPRSNKKTSYRHIPHSEKPAHLVAKRNERERKRVQAVNSAFLRLRKYVPHEPRDKRLSKFKTLKFAIQYIQNMQDMIQSYDWQTNAKRKNLAPHSNGNARAASDCFRFSSDNHRYTTVNNRPLLNSLPISNFTSLVDPVESNSCENSRDQSLADRHNNDNNNNNHSISNLYGSCENRPTCEIDSRPSSDLLEYGGQYRYVEPKYRDQRYNYNNQNVKYHNGSYQEFSYRVNYQPLASRTNTQNGYSPQFQAVTHEQDCVHRNFPDFWYNLLPDHCSSQSHTPNTTPPPSAETWEDCGSDISCSTTQDLSQSSEPIPSFHQVISFIDTGNCRYNNAIRSDFQYQEREPVYVCDNAGFPVNRSTFALDY